MATPPPLEHKSAPALLEPRPTRSGGPATPAPGLTDVDPDTGTITALVAVTGVPDDVGDVLQPGCFRRTLRERDPRMAVGHDWQRIAGKAIECVELMPGDPRLPAQAPDGSPWPDAAGALWVKARFLLATREGREQHEIAKAFGPSQGFSIGYKVTENGATVRNGLRHITDLDVYEFSPVLFGANRLATQLSVKSAATALRTAVATATCGACGRPAAGSVEHIPPGGVLLCPSCCGEVDALTGYLSRTREDAELDHDDGTAPSLADLDGAPGSDDGDTEDRDPDGDSTAEAPDDDGADYGDARDLLTRLDCTLCGQTAGGQIGGIAPEQDVYCPACVGAITELADDLADAADGDDRQPTSADEYRAALVAQDVYDINPDGTLAEVADDPTSGQAWRQR